MAAQRENISTNEANTEEGKWKNETKISNHIIHMPGTMKKVVPTHRLVNYASSKFLIYISIIATELCIVLNIFAKPYCIWSAYRGQTLLEFPLNHLTFNSE